MNRSDAERLQGVLAGLGYSRAERDAEASLAVVVACSVRQSAIDHVIRRAGQWQKRRRQGGLKTVLTGCVLDQDRERMSELFDAVLPVTEIGKIGEMVNDSELRIANKGLKTKEGMSTSGDTCHSERNRGIPFDGSLSEGHVNDYLSLPPSYDSKFQAYVPIMTGCDNFCAYCAVPYTRGREKSRPVQEVVDECRGLVAQGYKEIILLGQNVNSYAGFDGAGEICSFPELLRLIDGLDGDYWLRFATSHPKDFSDELIGAMSDGKHVTPYLHLALQSGDDEILKAMNRKYTAAHFEELVARARQAIPSLMVSTDVIVGFPGETQQQFQNTAELMERVGFDMAYLAEYSPREGTAAAKLQDNVLPEEKCRRKEFLNDILKKTGLANNEKYVGREVLVLVDEYRSGKCSGKTDAYKTVVFGGDESLVGQFVKVKIQRVDSFALFG